MDFHSTIETNEWSDVEARLECALDTLGENDHELLKCDAHERTICQHLAKYLETAFSGYHVDVEYNRYRMDPKKVEVDPEGNKKFVYPDLIVHRRGNDHSNLLVMEVKKSTNRDPRDDDRRKLNRCAKQFSYSFAVLLNIPAGSDFETDGCRPSIERVYPPQVGPNLGVRLW